MPSPMCWHLMAYVPQAEGAYADSKAANPPQTHLLIHPGQQVGLRAPGLCICLGPGLGPHIDQPLRHLHGQVRTVAGFVSAMLRILSTQNRTCVS